jgi:hypothetical protein
MKEARHEPIHLCWQAVQPEWAVRSEQGHGIRVRSAVRSDIGIDICGYSCQGMSQDIELSLLLLLEIVV